MKYSNHLSSLNQYQVPQWYKDAKFGIFIHWGLYSVPSKFTEWYPRYLYHTEESIKRANPFMVDGKFVEATPGDLEFMQNLAKELQASHRDRYGDPKTFGYKDFIPLFKGERFDPSEWTEIIKNSGAKYAIPVGEHHDGFSMYESQINPWNSLKMGPQRDIGLELKKAFESKGLRFGTSSHRAWNWRYYNFDKNLGYDNTDPKFASFYGEPHPIDEAPNQAFIQDWRQRTIEMIDHLEPDLLWFDFGWHEDGFSPYYNEILAHLYNKAEARGSEAVLNHKGCLDDSLAVYNVERGLMDDIHRHYWQGDTSISHMGWGHIVNDQLKTPARLIYDLVDIVSKNGNFLLNIGPRADGSIPEEVVGVLNSMGSWLNINGEAIYGSSPWKVWGEHSPQTQQRQLNAGHYNEERDLQYNHRDMRFTTKGDCVYAILFDWPGMEIEIESLGRNAGRIKNVKEVSLLGAPQALAHSWTDCSLKISLPNQRPCDHAYVVKIQQD